MSVHKPVMASVSTLMSCPFTRGHHKSQTYTYCSRIDKWPLTPKIDTATWAFLGLSDMRHGLLKDSDMGHDHFLKSTGKTGALLKFDRATLPFLKIDMRSRDSPLPPVKGPR